ncbi:methyl-accepting chemotaxis protein [Sphaerotilus sp.]|jgi:methyl-accepting chemotaxis protein|uniref:methyl-accepting chemotaxis protein n=1 Tax=Sphaerotilus sp. TaxID=2093942 RepID=UPI0026000451|nr:methyl-accepting chemotaxis protein [Sphaerotilus sp.]
MSTTSSTHPALAAAQVRPVAAAADAHRLVSASAIAAAAGAGALALQWGGWAGVLVVVLGFGVLGAWTSVAARQIGHTRSQALHHRSAATLAEPVVSRWQHLLSHVQRTTHQHRRQLDARIVHTHQELESTLNGHVRAAAATPLLDELMERHRKVLDTLLHHSRTTARLRTDTLTAAGAMAQALDALNTLAREVQTISRATHLLALNASVEATRAGERGGGFAVVAQEVRQLAAQSRQAGTQIARQIGQMQASLDTVLQRAGRDDLDPHASDTDVAMQAEEHARQVVRAVADEVGGVRREARELFAQCQRLQDQIRTLGEDAKALDQTHPALESLLQDMQRLRHWLLGADDAAAAAPADWLLRLDTTIDTAQRVRANHGTAG